MGRTRKSTKAERVSSVCGLNVRGSEVSCVEIDERLHVVYLLALWILCSCGSVERDGKVVGPV
jgi:hypothetical protein